MDEQVIVPTISIYLLSSLKFILSSEFSKLCEVEEIYNYLLCVYIFSEISTRCSYFQISCYVAMYLRDRIYILKTFFF